MGILQNTFNVYVKTASPIVGSVMFSLFLITFILFPTTDAYSFKIDCVPNVDFNEFPICEFEDLWNQSEEFNELVVQKLSNRANDINADPNSFQKIYSDSIDEVNYENPGLYEECQKIKNWIREQLVNNK